LLNGVYGSFDFNDEEWLGFRGKDFVAVVDLQESTSVRQIECGFLINQGSWIFCPSTVIISASVDGITFHELKVFKEDSGKRNDLQEVKKFKVTFENQSLRYIRIEAENIGTCPDWHPGVDGKTWLFVDEIVIN